MLMEHAKSLIGMYHKAVQDVAGILSSHDCTTGSPNHRYMTPCGWELDNAACFECAAYDAIRELASGKKEPGYA